MKAALFAIGGILSGWLLKFLKFWAESFLGDWGRYFPFRSLRSGYLSFVRPRAEHSVQIQSFRRRRKRKALRFGACRVPDLHRNYLRKKPRCTADSERFRLFEGPFFRTERRQARRAGNAGSLPQFGAAGPYRLRIPQPLRPFQGRKRPTSIFANGV